MPRGGSITRRDAVVGLVAGSCLVLDGKLSVVSSQPRSCTARFKGEVVAKWLNDGRNMVLVEPFEFISRDCRRWPVPKGAVTDGASIPQFFWAALGGPYEGKYREAAVIHDYYCGTRDRKYTSVHSVFYDAMLVSGVQTKTAWLMFQAVNKFGPRWPDPPVDDPRCDVVDENYDFSACSLNASKAQIEWPAFSKSLATEFIESVKGEGNQDDIARLRNALVQLR